MEQLLSPASSFLQSRVCLRVTTSQIGFRQRPHSSPRQYNTMATDQTITGTFLTPMGVPIANGTLVLQLGHDGQSATPNQVVAGLRVSITLNSSGQISPPAAIYSNTGLLPAN